MTSRARATISGDFAKGVVTLRYSFTDKDKESDSKAWVLKRPRTIALPANTAERKKRRERLLRVKEAFLTSVKADSTNVLLPPPLAYLYSHWPRDAADKTWSIELIADYYKDLAQYRGRRRSGKTVKALGPPIISLIAPPEIGEPPEAAGKDPEIQREVVTWLHEYALFGETPRSSGYRMKISLEDIVGGGGGSWEFTPVVVFHSKLHPVVPACFRLDPWDKTTKFFLDGFGEEESDLPPEGTRQLLVSSSVVRRGLLVAAEAWRNPAIKNLLLFAPPGSGKERLSEYIAAGDQTRRESKGDVKVSLAECSAEAAYNRVGAAVAALTDGRRSICAVMCDAFGGRFGAPSENREKVVGAVILDEAEKPAPSVRSALLRVLENRKIAWAPETGPASEYDLNEVLFIVNVARPLRELRQSVGPVDFWTRIHRSVEMAHPLNDDGKDVLTDYLTMFFAMALDRFVDKKTTESPALLRPLGQAGVAFGTQLKADGVLRDLAEATAHALEDLVRVSLPSIRDLRTVCERIVSELVTDDVLRGGLRVLKASVGRAFAEQLHEWCGRRVAAIYLEQVI